MEVFCNSVDWTLLFLNTLNLAEYQDIFRIQLVFLAKYQPMFLYIWLSSCFTSSIVFKTCSEVTEKFPAYQLQIPGLCLIQL